MFLGNAEKHEKSSLLLQLLAIQEFFETNIARLGAQNSGTDCQLASVISLWINHDFDSTIGADSTNGSFGMSRAIASHGHGE